MVKKRKQVIDEDVATLEKEGDISVDAEIDVVDKTKEENKQEFDLISVEADDQDQKKRLDEIEQTVSKQGSKKKKILNWIFFATNIAVVIGILVYQLLKEEVKAPVDLKIFALPFLVLIFFFLLNIFLDTFTISYLMKRNTGKWRPGLSYKTNVIGRYYDAVTPLSSGGQPFQISYLKNRDVPIHSAMSIPLTKMVFQQICWVLVALVCMIIALASSKYNAFVSFASVIGFILGSTMLLIVMFFSMSRKGARKVVVMILKLLQKMKILKNYEKYYVKIMKTVEDYQSIMRHFAKSPKDFLVLFFSYLGRMMILYSIPYLVFSLYKGFNGSLYFDFLIMSVLIDLAASFFPLPGGTGMSELSFSTMFASYFSGGTFFWAFITWRFFSYYYYLIQGLCIISYDMAYGNRKFKWTLRKETLVEESKLFKQEQINRFKAERTKQRRNQNKIQKKSV